MIKKKLPLLSLQFTGPRTSQRKKKKKERKKQFCNKEGIHSSSPKPAPSSWGEKEVRVRRALSQHC